MSYKSSRGSLPCFSIQNPNTSIFDLPKPQRKSRLQSKVEKAVQQLASERLCGIAIHQDSRSSIETIPYLRHHSHVPSRASSASANRPLSSDGDVNNSRKLRLPIMSLHHRDKSALQLCENTSPPAGASSTDPDQRIQVALTHSCHLRG
jgi:hypothetical protein